MEIATDIQYVGVNDFKIDLFEGMYRVPEGMAYNSYVILDEKIVIVDTVDAEFAEEWLEKIRNVLGERKPDYLIVQHMEPDHSANIGKLTEQFPDIVPVATARAFMMMRNMFGTEFAEHRIVVEDGQVLALGNHKLKFLAAPMVHWPEVMMTYVEDAGILFSADAFGKFGALAMEEKVCVESWMREAARYYFGIVGKYGVYVQKLLDKVKELEIRRICPLHGPILQEAIGEYMGLYHMWSAYEACREGVVIAYTSVYGNTARAVKMFEEKLKQSSCRDVIVHDLARCDIMEAVADAFLYDKLVLATTTYNAELFPFMREFIFHLTERNFSNRKVALIENGGWAPVAAKIMRERLEKCKGIEFVEPVVRILSTVNEQNQKQMEILAAQIGRS